MKYSFLYSKVFLLAFFLLTISSCDNNDLGVELSELGDDYIVFGHFYGECAGETCVENFALTKDKLYEDTNDSYGGTDFNFVEVSSEKFDLATGLENEFPTELLDATEEVFGCPDCGDWGGLYVEYVKDGERKGWQIDLMLDDVPNYLHDFIEEIQTKIELISD